MNETLENALRFLRSYLNGGDSGDFWSVDPWMESEERAQLVRTIETLEAQGVRSLD